MGCKIIGAISTNVTNYTIVQLYNLNGCVHGNGTKMPCNKSLTNPVNNSKHQAKPSLPQKTLNKASQHTASKYSTMQHTTIPLKQ